MTLEEVRALSDEEVRVKVAEKCGWVRSKKPFPNSRDTWHQPDTMLKMPWTFDELPEFEVNLNASYGLEQSLTDAQYERYMTDLWRIVNDDQPRQESAPISCERAYLSASADQRARAFLMV